MTTDRHYAAQLAALNREFLAAFGETETFATARRDGEEWETNGRWYARKGGRTQRIANPKGGGGGPKNLPADPAKKSPLPDGSPAPAGDFKVRGGLPKMAPAAPEPAAPAMPAGPTTRQTRGGVRVTMHPYQKPRPLAPGDMVPESMAKAPPPTPAEKARLDAHQQADAQKYGGRAAGIIRKVTEAVRGLFTLGGLTAGAGIGAKVGLAVGGPLGLGVGTAVGGGLGALLGKWGGSRVGKSSGEAVAPAVPRMAARLRRLGRAVGRNMAGALAVPGAVAEKAMAAVIDPDFAPSVREEVADARYAMDMNNATSEVARRQADRRRSAPSSPKPPTPPPADPRNVPRPRWGRRFAEMFAEEGLPPDVVAVVKARLAELGFPDAPDEVVARAIEMALADDGTTALAEANRTLARAGRKLGRLTPR